MSQTKSSTTQNSHVSETIQNKSLSRPGSDVNVNYEPFLPEGQCAGINHVPTISERKTRSESRLSGYVIFSVLEPPTGDDLEQEGSLTRSIAAKDSAAS
jgi:hypothetical protein